MSRTNMNEWSRVFSWENFKMRFFFWNNEIFLGHNKPKLIEFFFRYHVCWKVMFWNGHLLPLPRLSSFLIPFAFLVRQQCGLRLPIVIRGWRDGTSYVLPQVTNWSRRTLSITASDESLSYSKAFIIFFVFWKTEKKENKARWSDCWWWLSLPANNDVIIMDHWVDPHYSVDPTSLLGR